MRSTLIAAAVALFPVSATAQICDVPYASSYEDQVENEINRLLCLHNQQSELLNSHSDFIERQTQQMREMEQEIARLRAEIDSK